MFSYCLKYSKSVESKNPKVVKTKIGRIRLLSKCLKCNSKKSKFCKEQKARGIKLPHLSNFPILNAIFKKCKINAIISKFLLAEDKFMSEMHLRQPRFTYSACGLFTKNKERIKKLKK